MEPTTLTTQPDVPASAPTVHVSLSPVGVIGEVILGETGFKAEELAQRIAERVRERQDALRAEVTIAARYPEYKPAPVSGIRTQEIYTLYGSAVASERGTRRLVGVAAQGMTACPCAQQIVAGHARERLSADGFSDAEIARILDAVPVATHNQRGELRQELVSGEHLAHHTSMREWLDAVGR